jgi:hypothetical protein
MNALGLTAYAIPNGGVTGQIPFNMTMSGSKQRTVNQKYTTYIQYYQCLFTCLWWWWEPHWFVRDICDQGAAFVAARPACW